MDPTSVLKLVREQKRQIDMSHQPINSNSPNSLNKDNLKMHAEMNFPSNFAKLGTDSAHSDHSKLYHHNIKVGVKYMTMFPYKQQDTSGNMNQIAYNQQHILRNKSLNYIPTINGSNQSNPSNYSFNHQMDSLSRSGSAKSSTSDSGIGSTSPFSDCSDFSISNSVPLNNHSMNLQKINKKTQQQVYSMNKPYQFSNLAQLEEPIKLQSIDYRAYKIAMDKQQKSNMVLVNNNGSQIVYDKSLIPNQIKNFADNCAYPVAVATKRKYSEFHNDQLNMTESYQNQQRRINLMNDFKLNPTHGYQQNIQSDSHEYRIAALANVHQQQAHENAINACKQYNTYNKMPAEFINENHFNMKNQFEQQRHGPNKPMYHMLPRVQNIPAQQQQPSHLYQQHQNSQIFSTTKSSSELNKQQQHQKKFTLISQNNIHKQYAQCSCPDCNKTVPKQNQSEFNTYGVKPQPLYCSCSNPNCTYNQMKNKTNVPMYNQSQAGLYEQMCKVEKLSNDNKAVYDLLSAPNIPNSISERLIPQPYFNSNNHLMIANKNELNQKLPNNYQLQKANYYNLVQPTNAANPALNHSNSPQISKHWQNIPYDHTQTKTYEQDSIKRMKQKYIVISDSELDSANGQDSKSKTSTIKHLKLSKTHKLLAHEKSKKQKSGNKQIKTTDTDNYNKNLNLLIQAKNTLNILAQKSDPSTAAIKRNRYSAESIASENDSRSSTSTSSSSQHNTIVASIPSSIPTSVVCLSVNTNKINDNEIELGEVIRYDEIAKSNSIDFIDKDSVESLGYPWKIEKIKNENFKASTVLSPVTLSKKILMIVTPRIQEWLERSSELAYKMSDKYKIELAKLFELFERAWSRLLIIYMIENSFEFWVTKDSRQLALIEAKQKENEHSNSQVNEIDEKEKYDITTPQETDATQIQGIIKDGSQFNLTIEQYDLLREIVLLKEAGEEETQLNDLYSKTNANFKAILEEPNKEMFTKLMKSFLPSIYTVKSEIVESLFCRNLKDFQTVNVFIKSRWEIFLNRTQV